MRRFYIDSIPTDSAFCLPEDESKHIVKVLRYSVGDSFIVLDGKGLVVTVEMEESHPKKCHVKVLKRECVARSENQFHLAIAPTKNMDRMEWLVEKIVEIGCTRLSFIQCEHSERVQLKLDRLQRVAISAMKQAQHDFLLQIDELTRFDLFVKENQGGGIAHCVEIEKIGVGQLKNKARILIGPEGDFSSKEIALAIENGYEPVHLGTSRLRTETAGMVACTLAIISAN